MYQEDLLIQLINNIVERSEESFNQLYEMTHERVFKYLYRIVNDKHIAEDLLIETYVQVWKTARNYRYQSKVLTWLIGIAKNVAMSEFRKRKMKELELDENISSPAQQTSDCSYSENSEIIEEALNRLSVKHREVLDLVFLQGMSYEDISQVMSVPVNTVKTRVFYAKEKLRNIFTLMGIEKDDVL